MSNSKVNDKNERFIFSQNGKLFEFHHQGEDELILSRQELLLYNLAYSCQYYLGVLDGERVFLLIGDKNQDTEEHLVPKEAHLRSWLNKSTCDQYFSVLSRAAQLATWHSQHCFCPRCATVLEAHETDHAKVCPSCELAQYPRISPCVIMLVVDGDRCLLAHGVRHKEKMYSTLAGFIEAGESAESAVIREVKEEVGVDVGLPTYQFSQSWPFPHSFMIGFIAPYLGGDIVIDESEITDAQWFTREQLLEEREGFAIPPAFTIARKLIDLFLDGKA